MRYVLGKGLVKNVAYKTCSDILCLEQVLVSVLFLFVMLTLDKSRQQAYQLHFAKRHQTVKNIVPVMRHRLELLSDNSVYSHSSRHFNRKLK